MIDVVAPAFHLVIPAAGLGTRLGPGEPKTWREIAGKPVLAWTLDRLAPLRPMRVVVAVEADRAAGARPSWLAPEVLLVAGGANRASSVALALEALESDDDDLVAVHDGARPAVGLEDFVRVLQAASASGAALLGRRVSDTLKRVRDGRVVETVDRDELGRAETPQVASYGLLRAALAGGRGELTDESAALERAGHSVTWVEALEPNPKLTTPADLPLLRLLLGGEGAA